LHESVGFSDSIITICAEYNNSCFCRWNPTLHCAIIRPVERLGMERLSRLHFWWDGKSSSTHYLCQAVHHHRRREDRAGRDGVQHTGHAGGLSLHTIRGVPWATTLHPEVNFLLN